MSVYVSVLMSRRDKSLHACFDRPHVLSITACIFSL